MTSCCRAWSSDEVAHRGDPVHVVPPMARRRCYAEGIARGAGGDGGASNSREWSGSDFGNGSGMGVVGLCS